MSIHEDFALFDDFRSGSRRALGRYVSHYGGGIHYFLEKKMGSAKATKEAVMEVFTILYESRGMIGSPAELWSFLYSTAKKVASKYAGEQDGKDIDLFKPLGRRRPLTEENEKRGVELIANPRLAQAIEKLTDQQRVVAALYRQGKKPKEIAAILKLSPQTVRNHKTHGIRRLRAAFGDNWVEINPFVA